MTTIQKTAEHFGCTAKAVRAHLRRLGYTAADYADMTAKQIIATLTKNEAKA